ncbi:DUF2971 domain-containing protein [Amantichitinum ursilacus]|uniref:DUF2971 domain-containing protein n=1 Tax=Amantichitinum ursilacus TaxID=857265 RepID=A0A0N0XKF7_9NEIS|nr:DUF2971 domain-containing protein [Amantichitinum ursilacus]KPC54568.1 hypothetical protein WG78_03315 [Amantichitinum ursilacus]
MSVRKIEIETDYGVVSLNFWNGPLFKYKSLDGNGIHHVLELIRNRLLYFPKPSILNDPEECKPNYVLGNYGDPDYRPRVHAWARRCMLGREPHPSEEEMQVELDGLTQEKLDALLPAANADIHRELDAKMRIMSLSTSAQNQHLWNEYACNHKGIAIELDLRNQLALAQEVIYHDEIRTIDLTDSMSFDDLKKGVLTKTTIWAPEQEYRYVLQQPRLQGDPELRDDKLLIDERALRSITFGYNTSPAHITQIVEAIRAHQPWVELHQTIGRPPEQHFNRVQYRG